MGSGISSNTAGFIGSAVAIVGFGSNFVPVKHVETGDGKFRRVRAGSRTYGAWPWCTNKFGWIRTLLTNDNQAENQRVIPIDLLIFLNLL